MASCTTTTLHTVARSNVRLERPARGRRAISAFNKRQSIGRSSRANLEVSCVVGGVKLNTDAEGKRVEYGARLIGAFPPIMFALGNHLNHLLT